MIFAFGKPGRSNTTCCPCTVLFLPLFYWFTTSFYFRSPTSLILEPKRAACAGTWHDCQRCTAGVHGACISYILNWLEANVIFHFDLFIQNPFFLRYNILYYFDFKLFSTRDDQLALVIKGFLILFVQGILLCRRNMPSFFQALYLHWEHFLSLRIWRRERTVHLITDMFILQIFRWNIQISRTTRKSTGMWLRLQHLTYSQAKSQARGNELNIWFSSYRRCAGL